MLAAAGLCVVLVRQVSGLNGRRVVTVVEMLGLIISVPTRCCVVDLCRLQTTGRRTKRRAVDGGRCVRNGSGAVM